MQRLTKEYRLSITPALEVSQQEISFEFVTLDELIAAKNTAAELLLFLHNIKTMRDYSNIFVIELWDGSEWVEIDEDGIEI